jgi:hypothetical protein
MGTASGPRLRTFWEKAREPPGFAGTTGKALDIRYA